jgi:hypothetical protein
MPIFTKVKPNMKKVVLTTLPAHLDAETGKDFSDFINGEHQKNDELDPDPDPDPRQFANEKPK